MVGSGLLNTVVLTRYTLIETVHGDRDERDRLYYRSSHCCHDLYRVYSNMDRNVLGSACDIV